MEWNNDVEIFIIVIYFVLPLIAILAVIIGLILLFLHLRKK